MFGKSTISFIFDAFVLAYIGFWIMLAGTFHAYSFSALKTYVHDFNKQFQQSRHEKIGVCSFRAQGPKFRTIPYSKTSHQKTQNSLKFYASTTIAWMGSQTEDTLVGSFCSHLVEWSFEGGWKVKRFWNN